MTATTDVPSRSLPVAALVALRPRQWLKNVLVFAAPVAAGAILKPDVLAATIGAFVAFCLVSSATYLVNDARDIAIDRLHPRKRMRPIAAGQLPVPAALIGAVLIGLIGLALAFAIAVNLGIVLVIYIAMTIAYSLGLKHEPVVEMVILACGFLLRAIAGGVASGLPISTWFLIVTGFGSLFMAAGKRYSELVRTDESGTVRRRALDGYGPNYLRFVWATSAAVTIAGYCLWAFEVAGTVDAIAWAAEVSVIPFVLGILRYAMDVDRGSAEAPEEVILGDRVLLVIGLLWLVLFALGSFGTSVFGLAA